MENQDKIVKKIISKHDFYFEVPLYEELDLDSIEESFLDGDVDAYSAKNHDNTTYEISAERLSRFSTHELYKYFSVQLDCKRKDNDTLVFFVYIKNKKVVKVGQNPSLADIQFEKIGKKYDKILTQEDLTNYRKAIGLAAHGVGAGSFVYLRRIFENLINNTYQENKSELNQPDFISKRMSEKVELLVDYLPKQIKEMDALYGVISKGVHELSEDECRKYFPALRLSIELILDEKIEEAVKKEKDIKVKESLSEINSILKNKD